MDEKQDSQIHWLKELLLHYIHCGDYKTATTDE